MLGFWVFFLIIQLSHRGVILSYVASLNKQENPFFVSILEMRHTLQIALVQKKLNETSALQYYSRQYWDTDTGYSHSSITKLWKDDDIIFNKSQNQDLCFSRLMGYTDNGSRIASEVYNPLRIWSNLVEFKKVAFSPETPPSIVFINFVANDRRNPYWFWRPRYLHFLGGGVEAFITSMPSYIPPIDNEFLPSRFQRFKGPLPGAYNVLAFPVVPGGTYHIQLRILRGSSWTKQLRILPASLHDVRLTLEKNEPVLRTEAEFESMRVIKNGTIYLSRDGEKTIENTTQEHESTAKENAIVNSSYVTPFQDLSDDDMRLRPFEPLRLKKELQFLLQLQSLAFMKPHNSLDQIYETISRLKRGFSEISIQHVIYRLASRNLLFKAHNLKMTKSSRVTLPSRETTNRPILEYIDIALEKYDWASLEQLENYRSQAVYHELQILSRQRLQVLTVLFEPFIASFSDTAFQRLDHQVLKMMRHMSLRRLWRGFLIALESFDTPDGSNEIFQGCENLEIVLANRSVLKCSTRELLLPSSVHFKRNEINDEYSIFQLLIRRYGRPKSDLTNITLANEWILPYCSRSTFDITKRQHLKTWSTITDPATVIAKMLTPLFPIAENLVFHGVLLVELLRRYPKAEYFKQYSDSNSLVSGYEFMEILQNPIRLKNTLLHNETALTQWIGQWHQSFVESLAQILFHYSDKSKKMQSFYPVPSVNLSGYIPHSPDYFSVRQKMFLVEGYKTLGTIQPHDIFHDTRCKTHQMRHHLFILSHNASLVDSTEIGVSRLEPLKTLLSRQMAQKTNLCENKLSLGLETIELRISASFIDSVKSIADVITFFSTTHLYQDYETQKLRINLIIMDVFGFPDTLIPFFQLIRLQRIRQIESYYAKSMNTLLPLLLRQTGRSVCHHLMRHRSSPLFADTTQTTLWYNLEETQTQKDQWTNEAMSGFCFFQDDLLKTRSHALRVRVEKFLYYTHLKERLHMRIENSNLSRNAEQMRRDYCTNTGNLSSEHAVYTIFSTAGISESICEAIVEHQEDTQRIHIQQVIAAPKSRTDFQKTPLWDVVVVPLDKLHPRAASVTFLINEGDPYSYFFKGRSNRYEPNILPNIPSISSVHGMLSGHHFAIHVH